MAIGASRLSAPIPNTEGVSFVPPTIVESFSIVWIVDDESGTRHEGPHTNIDALMP